MLRLYTILVSRVFIRSDFLSGWFSKDVSDGFRIRILLDVWFFFGSDAFFGLGLVFLRIWFAFFGLGLVFFGFGLVWLFSGIRFFQAQDSGLV